MYFEREGGGVIVLTWRCIWEERRTVCVRGSCLCVQRCYCVSLEGG